MEWRERENILMSVSCAVITRVQFSTGSKICMWCDPWENFQVITSQTKRILVKVTSSFSFPSRCMPHIRSAKPPSSSSHKNTNTILLTNPNTHVLPLFSQSHNTHTRSQWRAHTNAHKNTFIPLIMLMMMMTIFTFTIAFDDCLWSKILYICRIC